MATNYLSLEEAADQLGMQPDELIRLREQGEIRGFADRGTWKFRAEDIGEFGRTRTDAGASVLGDEDAIGEQPTIVRQNAQDDEDDLSGATSDSDVRLILDDTLDDDDSDPDLTMLAGADSDSDVRLASDSAPALDPGSDSDARLAEADSDSDVRLAEADSDSDVQLAGTDSDSDVQLAGTDSDSDVQLAGTDSDSDVQFVSDAPATDSDVQSAGPDDSSVLSGDSGVALEGGSSNLPLDDSSGSGLPLAGETSDVLLDEDDSDLALGSTTSGLALDGDDSGISLEDFDSGISLADDDDGITLASDSGIALEAASDSGIALEALNAGSDDELNRTAPMLEAVSDDEDDTHFEVPSLSDDDEETALEASKGPDDTSVIMFDEDDDFDDQTATAIKPGGDDSADIFDMESADEFGTVDDFDDFGEDEDLEVTADVLGEDDELDDLDVFDAADEDFDDTFQSGESQSEFIAPMAGRMAAPVEAEWGVPEFAGLIASSVLMLLCGWVMFDLVRSMWGWSEPGVVGSAMIDIFGGLF